MNEGQFDVIVVGGGHNGLTCAAYLARAGRRVCVLERRELVGGACVTEEVWPGHRLSRASYVVSLLQPKIISDLRLGEFGFEAYPSDPGYATFVPGGGAMLLWNDAARLQDSVARHSPADARAYPEFSAMLRRVGDFLRPLLLRPPPALGSRRPGDVAGMLREAGRAAGRSRRELEEVYRMMTTSVGDLLDDWFEHDAFKGTYASTGVVGVWAGPRTPGTAYNLLHHEMGELDGVAGMWGQTRGGMGGISDAIRRSAEAHGATVRTSAAVERIEVAGGHVTGVTLTSGEELRAAVVASGAHPKTTVLDLVGGGHFPDEVVRDMQRYKTRGGSVKVNCVLSELPRYEGVSAEEQEALVRTGVALCPSIDYLERGWDDAKHGRPAEGPYLEAWIPSTVDPTLTDPDHHVMTLFTQFGPPREEDWPEGSREAYGDRCIDLLAQYAPNIKDAIVEREVLAPPDLERIYGLLGGNIFQGEQGLDQMAFMRPTPLLSRYSTPVDGLYLCGAGCHPGGGVMGAPGHNAAHRILSDQRRADWARRVPFAARS